MAGGGPSRRRRREKLRCGRVAAEDVVDVARAKLRARWVRGREPIGAGHELLLQGLAFPSVYQTKRN